MTSPADPDTERIERAVTDAFDAALLACATNARGLSDARVAIAYSGGLDSSVLLDAAVRVVGASRCVALHVHHGLSPHADQWLAHCESVARAYGVTFAAQRVNVPLRPDAGIEAAARTARYRALDALCATHRAHALWLAQHADDQAETVLLQLLRGAGLAGLAAMAPVSAGGRQSRGQNETIDSDSIPRVRPLLALSRAQLERYARARALRWIDDESNADLRYARNALRHTVVPALSTHFPGFRHALARTATHAASAQQLLDDLARIDLHRVGANADAGVGANVNANASASVNAGASMDAEASHALRLDALLALDDARASNLLRYWMRTLNLPAASTARIGDALRQLRDVASMGARNANATHDDGARATRETRATGKSANDHLLRIDHAGQRLRCYRGLVFWETATMSATSKTGPRDTAQQIWRGEEVWRLPQWRGTFVFAPVDAGGVEGADGTIGAAIGAIGTEGTSGVDGNDTNGTEDTEGAENTSNPTRANDKTAVPETLLRRAPLIARARSGGERMRCTPDGPTRTLKNLFQERGVPAWARDVPLLFSGDTLLFVPSIGLNHAALAQIAAPSPATRWRRIEWREDLLIA